MSISDRLLDIVLGPQGAIASAFLIAGVWVYHKFIAPQIFGPRITNMEEKVQAHEKRIFELEQELEPWRKFRDEQAMGALHPERLA